GGGPYARVAASSHAGAGGGDEAELLARALAGLPSQEAGLVVGNGGAEEAEVVLAGRRGGPLTSSTVHTGDCGAATGALNLAVAALAIRTGLAPALRGLAHPCAGDLDDYLTKPGLPVPPDRVLVLSAAPGSVRGAVLLEAP
ncbi:3-oxoacyl-ACP synthase, partial [Nonomuraea insulae]